MEDQVDNVLTEIEPRSMPAGIEAQMMSAAPAPQLARPGFRTWVASLTVLGIVGVGITFGPRMLPAPPAAAAAPPPGVTVRVPLQRQVDSQLELLGQFSAVQQVEL